MPIAYRSNVQHIVDRRQPAPVVEAQAPVAAETPPHLESVVSFKSFTRRAWTNRDVETLKRMAAEGWHAPEIGAALGRHKVSIYSRARQEGITLPERANLWSAEDITRMRELIETNAPFDEFLKAFPHRSRGAVTMKKHELVHKGEAA